MSAPRIVHQDTRQAYTPSKPCAAQRYAIKHTLIAGYAIPAVGMFHSTQCFSSQLKLITFRISYQSCSMLGGGTYFETYTVATNPLQRAGIYIVMHVQEIWSSKTVLSQVQPPDVTTRSYITAHCLSPSLLVYSTHLRKRRHAEEERPRMALGIHTGMYWTRYQSGKTCIGVSLHLGHCVDQLSQSLTWQQ